MWKSKLQKHEYLPYICVATFFLTVETNQSTLAFQILPPTNHKPNVSYILPRSNGGSVIIDTTLLPYTALSPSSSIAFPALNQYQQSPNHNWAFMPGPPLQGKFVIGNYLACGPYSLAGQSPPNILCGGTAAASNNINVGNFVGADFSVNYIPAANDPQVFIPSFGSPIPNNNLFWLQIIDFSIQGLSQQYLDNVPYGDPTPSIRYPYPYYPGKGYVPSTPPRFNGFSSLLFADTSLRPARIAANSLLTWKASLFLAELTGIDSSGNQVMTVYNGISWGWQTTFKIVSAPTPGPIASRGPKPPSNPNGVCPPGMPTGSCIAFGYLDNLSINALVGSSLLSFDEASAPTVTSTNSQPGTDNTATVPEPSSMLGVLAVGAWAGVSWRKRRNQQSESELVAASST